MDWFAPKYRRNPNQMVHSAYVGVIPGGRTVKAIKAVNRDRDRLDTTSEYGMGMPRGASGRAGTFILGGMETTLDEVEYLVEAIKEKKFQQRRSAGQIVRMCNNLMDRRNEAVRYYKKNPSEAPKPKPKPRFYLPVGVRMVQTPEPGFEIAVRG